MGGVDTGMDSVLSVHSACPGTTSNQLACNDDTNTCGSLDTGSLRDSAVTVPVNAGSIYKLRVSVYADSAANNFLLHVNLLLPANDDCASASAVTSGGTPVSNCGATQDGVSTGCRAGFNDVWYGYTATCNGNVTVDTCNANFDSVLFAYSGTACPATQARQVACNDDFCGGSGLSSHIVFAATSGQAFLIRFASFDPAQSGSATMTVSCSVSCPCDWNRDAHLNSQDFFDFLTSFFAANADFNHDGITNSQDFFDFLSCLFAGCP
jgi:hypothetical protein